MIGVGPTNVNIQQWNGVTINSNTANFNQVAVSSITGTSILASFANRTAAMIMNNSGVSVYLGSSGTVTTTTGLELPTGSALNISRSNEGYTGAIFATAATGNTPTVSFMEV